MTPEVVKSGAGLLTNTDIKKYSQNDRFFLHSGHSLPSLHRSVISVPAFSNFLKILLIFGHFVTDLKI